MQKKILGENILSSFFPGLVSGNVRLNVALTFNVKPESETFHEFLPPNQNLNSSKNSIENTFPNQSDAITDVKPLPDTYAEWDTWDTINAVKDAIEKYNPVTLVEADEEAFINLREIKPDIVFNIAEGFNGVSREAQIPSILDMLKIPYSGSDPLTLATCLDKARTKEILSYYRIPNAKFIIAGRLLNQLKNINLKYPLIVKPVWEGSSKGIYSSSFVSSKPEMIREAERIITEYNQPALIEEFLPGREFTVAVLGNGEEAEILPIVEISYNDFPDDFNPIYSYEAKWILDTKENPLEVFNCPARIDKKLERKIKETVLSAYNILRCRDWSRIDVRLDSKGEPNIIEINPLPGILPNPEENSCFPKAARAAGIDYTEMINRVLYSAAKRYNLL